MNNILGAALEYLDQGFSVIPIRPGPEKKPYIPWTEFQKRLPTEEEIHTWWEKWPNANVAIITGAISGIFVIDGDGEIGARWISEHLPKTSVYAKTGRSHGCHCFYRIPAGEKIQNKVAWKPKVDIRGEGGYVVAAPSVHHTGAIYSLIFREGLEGWKELHEFNPFKTFGGNLGGINFANVKLPGEEFLPQEEGSRNATFASLLGKMLRAGAGGKEAWEWALGWNINNKPPLPEKEMKATFKSILKLHETSNPIGLLAPSPPGIKSADQSETTEEKVFQEKTDNYPVECLQPGGLLQEIMDYTEKSSASHKPIFALGAAIVIVGHICGQRVMTETGLRTNMYCVSIGYSGSGKNASHSTISTILASSNARQSMPPSDTASGAAMLRFMTTDNRQIALFTFDEFGMLLQGMRSPSSPMAEMPRILTRIFSATDRPDSKTYADAKLNITIPWHHLSLYASSTPSKFWGNLNEGDTISGFLARLLIFEAHDEIERARKSINSTIPKNLLEKVNKIWGITPPIDKERGDIARVPIPFVIPRSKDATIIFDSWSDKYWNLRNKFRDDNAKSAIYGRAAEHAGKLALIHAVSLKGPDIVGKEVGVESLIWATKITDACINTLLGGISQNIAKNTFHAEQQKILRIITAAGGELTTRDIYRKLHISVRTANETIQSLLISGEIRQEERMNGKGGKTTWIVLGV